MWSSYRNSRTNKHAQTHTQTTPTPSTLVYRFHQNNTNNASTTPVNIDIAKVDTRPGHWYKTKVNPLSKAYQFYEKNISSRKKGNPKTKPRKNNVNVIEIERMGTPTADRIAAIVTLKGDGGQYPKAARRRYRRIKDLLASDI